MPEITKTFRFAASHRLDGLPPDHKCMRLHGHNYMVIVSLRSPSLDSAGMVMDYGQLAPFADWLEGTLDHRHLGGGDVFDADGKLTDPAVLPFIPTAENLAGHLLGIAREMFGHFVTAVEVRETDNVTATARAAR
jgi:6-pyruvoyltetrahydropterin/6-carboxytetrahydropterin synthase